MSDDQHIAKLTEAVELLNALDDKRAAQIAELRDDLHALANRVEGCFRPLGPFPIRSYRKLAALDATRVRPEDV